MVNDYIIHNGELYHHGVKGQKWGVRRTKAQLGYKLSDFRKKRQTKRAADLKKRESYLKKEEALKAKEEELKARKQALKSGKPSKTDSKKKGLSDMTDDELASAINRARLEDAYNQLRPQQVSTGKALVSKFMHESVVPALVNSGRKGLENLIDNAISNKLKIEPSELDVLKKQYETLSLKSSIDKLKKYGDEPKAGSWKDMLNKQSYAENERKAQERRDAEDIAAGKKSANATKNAPTFDEWSKGKSGSSKSTDSKTNNSSKGKSNSNNKNNKTKDADFVEVVSGTVEDGPSSKKNSSSNNNSKSTFTFDAGMYGSSWSEVSNTPVSNLPATVVSTGRSYTSNVLALLEDKSR